MLFEPLFVHAQQQPQQPAVIDEQGPHSYQELAAWATALATHFADQTKRAHIGLLLPPGAGSVASFFAAMLAGKTVVPINYLLGEREIAHIVADSDIDTIVTVPFFIGRLSGLPLNLIDLTKVSQNPPPAVAPTFPTPSRDDIAVLLYTSGTSGLPKGVLLSYGNLDAVVDAALSHLGVQPAHTFLGIIPMFHSFGITTMLGSVRLGTTTTYIARFSPMATMTAIRTHKPSLIFGIPSMFAALLRMKEIKPEDFAHAYAVVSGGEPLPPTLREAFFQRLGVRLYEGYGLTETCAVIALNTPNENKPDTVGKLLPGAEAQFTSEEGKPVPAGQEGEIWLRAPWVMKGYHNLPAETAASLTPDGFFKTGDLGIEDTEGYLRISGRKKDLIIVSGEKVSPREIEDVLLRHPAVAEAVVLGKKDPGRGEIVAAFIMPREGQTISDDELRSFARTSGLAQWKIPREIFVVPELPRSATGKVLRRELAAKLNAG
jgi:long-chain acyl-CoA synthetase